MTKRKLPERFDLRITYDKKTKTHFAECLDDPNIYALSVNENDLVDRINAAIYDSYGISNKEAKKLGLRYRIVIIKEKSIGSRKITSRSERSRTVSLSSSFPAMGCV